MRHAAPPAAARARQAAVSRTARDAKNGRAANASRPIHKRCGTTLSRLYYTMYSRISRGSRILPLSDWMWCERCSAPVHMIQRDMWDGAAAAVEAAATTAPRSGRRRK